MIEVLKPYFEQKGDDLSTEERNLLQISYKNAIGLRRIAWRAVKQVGTLGKFKKYREDQKSYQAKLEEELVDLCKDMLSLITKHLYPRAKKGNKTEEMVFYLKLQGDYFRYVAEVGEGDRLQKATERALKCYNDAIELAEQLSPADPTRLSL